MLPWSVLTGAARCFVQPPAAPAGSSTPARVASLAPAAATPTTRERAAGRAGLLLAGGSRLVLCFLTLLPAVFMYSCFKAVTLGFWCLLPCVQQHGTPNPHPHPHTPAAMVGDSPLRRAALSAAPRLPNGSLPAAAAAASPAQPAMSTLVLLDTIGQVGWSVVTCALSAVRVIAGVWLAARQPKPNSSALVDMKWSSAGPGCCWCVLCPTAPCCRLLSLLQACLAADLPGELRGHPEFAFLAPEA